MANHSCSSLVTARSASAKPAARPACPEAGLNQPPLSVSSTAPVAISKIRSAENRAFISAYPFRTLFWCADDRIDLPITVNVEKQSWEGVSGTHATQDTPAQAMGNEGCGSFRFLRLRRWRGGRNGRPGGGASSCESRAGNLRPVAHPPWRHHDQEF